jgi:hypothetical protein
MEPLSRGEIIELVTFGLGTVGVFATITQVPGVRFRRFLFAVLTVMVIADAGILMRYVLGYRIVAEPVVRKPSPRQEPPPPIHTHAEGDAHAYAASRNGFTADVRCPSVFPFVERQKLDTPDVLH